MGRGDKKTAKGKRFLGSFGKSRPHKVASKASKVTKASTEKTTAPKTKATGSKSTAKTEKAAKTKA